MHRTQVYLEEKQVALAKLYAAQQGIAFSEFIRRGVDLAIEQQKNPQKQNKKAKHVHNPLEALVGNFSTGKGKVTNAALTHNDIYDL